MRLVLKGAVINCRAPQKCSLFIICVYIDNNMYAELWKTYLLILYRDKKFKSL